MGEFFKEAIFEFDYSARKQKEIEEIKKNGRFKNKESIIDNGFNHVSCV